MGTGDVRIAAAVMKHGDGTADVESTHHDDRPRRFEFQRKLPRPWKHVGLNSHQADDHYRIGSSPFFQDPLGIHTASHGFFVEYDYSSQTPCNHKPANATLTH